MGGTVGALGDRAVDRCHLVFVFLAISQNRSEPRLYLFTNAIFGFHKHDLNVQPGGGECLAWAPQNCTSTFCRWQSPVDFIRVWLWNWEEAPGMRVSTSESEAMVLGKQWVALFRLGTNPSPKWRSLSDMLYRTAVVQRELSLKAKRSVY